MEKFRTGRLVARSWQIGDLPLAMELWGDPAVTALIDARQIQWCSVLGVVRSPQWRFRRLRRTSAVGLYTQRGGFRSGVPYCEALLGKGLGTEAAQGALDYAWEKLQLSKVYAGHHPDNRASEKILKNLGFELIENVFYKPTGLMHPSYVCMAPTPRPDISRST